MSPQGDLTGANRFRVNPVRRGAPGLRSGQTLTPPIAGVAERRRRRRVAVQPMYTFALVRVLSRKAAPIEGYVVDLSETGMALETDALIPVGEAITVEFRIAGVGRLHNEEWPQFAIAAEVVRHDDVDDFPGGPYRTALRFGPLATMTQAQIARFIATQPG
jgi:hypothetical protein